MFSLTSTMRQLIDQLPLHSSRPRKKRLSVRLAAQSRPTAAGAVELSVPLFGLPTRIEPIFSSPLSDPPIVMAAAGTRPLRWRVDPADRRLTMISGSIQEVCDALDSMIDDE